MHTAVRPARGARAGRASRWPRPRTQVLAYVREFVPESAQGAARAATRSPPTAASSRGTCRRSTSTCTTAWSTSRSIKELARRWYPRAYFAAPEARRPPRPRRHQGEHRRSFGTTAKRSSCRSPARTRRRLARSPRSTAHRRPIPPTRPARHGDGAAAEAQAVEAVRTGTGSLHSSAACGSTSAVMVGVAQLVEHLVVVQVVAGSSPVTHPTARATRRSSSSTSVAVSRRSVPMSSAL